MFKETFVGERLTRFPAIDRSTTTLVDCLPFQGQSLTKGIFLSANRLIVIAVNATGLADWSANGYRRTIPSQKLGLTWGSILW